MIVTLIYKDEINSITLPNKIEGKYWIGTKEKKNLIGIEGNENKWVIKSNKKIKVVTENNIEIKSKEINLNTISRVKVGDEIALLFAEELTKDRQKYKKLIIDKDIGISIGRGNENVFCYKNDFVSNVHAKLSYHNKYWLIKDNQSTNGIFVNGKRVRTKDLEFGDVIYIMGLKIIVYYDFLMINNPDNNLTIKPGVFEEELDIFSKEKLGQNVQEEDEDEEDEDFLEDYKKDYFYRSPRFKRDIEAKTIKVDSPPDSTDGQRLPLVLTIGPSITMGLASLTSAAYSINNAVNSGNIQAYMPSIVMSISMLAGTLLWPLLTRFYEKITRKKVEKVRQAKYKEYLKNISEQIEEEKEKQISILKENFATIDECEDRILNTKRTLWERGLWQNDFLKIRLGVGNRPLELKLSYSEKKFTIAEDNLVNEMYDLCEKPKILENVPITASFFEDYISGVIGDRKKVKELAKGIIFQLASLYSYDELKMIFIYSEKDEQDFNFVKWLPHTFSDDKKFRFVATNLDEVKEISYFMENEILDRIEQTQNKDTEIEPYYVVFALDKDLSLKTEILNQIYGAKKNISISVINFFEQLQELPKECSMIIEMKENEVKMYDKNDISGEAVVFKPDIFVTSNPEKLSKKLCNIPLNTLESEYKLPTMIKFLQMFEVGKIEHLNVLNRWQENDPTKSLATPIGLDTYGELFKLDLHEKFHGPHGLVAGMTGSGKSEFIMTYILSLAVNYHPYEVAFILIDYKGGGMAKSFEKLPHVAGIITNLDGASINRALISINSELKRRQAIFDATSKKVGVSNIDIYKYQKLFREKQVTEPLPHLFIISDEFAELKSQRPEFMTELVSTARIGRSLGIHLILATQKPSGVVDDQIWSNSKFRICLKVQEKADSMDMLKRPDAAMLKETGRFYLQVGYNELFELGQSAWAGAPYYPTDKYIKEKDDSVVVIDNNARVLKAVKMDKNSSYKGKVNKQLDSITQYLSQTAKEEKIKAKQIWLEPIKETILLQDIEKKYNTKEEKFVINPVIGEYDNPSQQSQNCLRAPISNEGNMLIYGSQGSGKAMLLTTMIYSIITKHTPEEANIYILDFEAETLKAFEKAPHVGDVILSNDSEKITNLLKTIYKELENRKKKFSEFGGTYSTYIEESGNAVPNILIVINNYAAFAEMYGDKEDAINYLTREGSKYGIYFVITANGVNGIKYKMLQNFGRTIALQFNDESNYNLVLGKTGGILPQHYEGRGLIKLDKITYEFQTASLVEKDSNPYKFVREECSKLAEKNVGYTANKIAVLPKQITTSLLEKYAKNPLEVPIGMDKNTLEISYFKINKHYINFVLSEDRAYKQFLKDISNFMAEKYNNIDLTVIDEENEISNLNENIKHVVGKYETELQIDELFNLVLERNNKYKEAIEKKQKCEEFPQKIFIIKSLRNIFENKDDERIQKLELALEKGQKNYNITFIIFDEMKRLSVLSGKKWYKEHVKPEDGIWIGRGLANQYNLRITNLTGEIKKDLIDSNFAILIDNGIARIIKILNSQGGTNNE